MKLARAMVDGAPRYGDVDGENFFDLVGDTFTTLQRSGTSRPVAGLALMSPIDPTQMWAVMGGFNLTGAAEVPPPRLVPKTAFPVSGDGGEVVFPKFDETPDWTMNTEAELAVVVGRPLWRASQSEARDAIFGYTCFDDVTAVGLFNAADFSMAKSMWSFASMGPWIETTITDDDLEQGLAITSRCNGVECQRGDTAKFKALPSAVLSHLSRFVRVEAGAVVSMGTPPPPPSVSVGDVVECEVERIGMITNTIVAG